MGGEPFCPISESDPGGSAKCHTEEGGVPITEYCGGACSGVAGAVACRGWIDYGQQPVCNGCCMPGSQCCGPSTTNYQDYNHCCPDSTTCCAKGCVEPGGVCCGNQMACTPQQTCCSYWVGSYNLFSCCNSTESCLSGGCCRKEMQCGGTCCREGETCIGVSCTKPQPCVYLGVNLTELGSAYKRNDTFAYHREDWLLFNPCGRLLYTKEQYSCNGETWGCWNNGVAIANEPIIPYFDSEGRIALYGEAQGEFDLNSMNVTFTCGSHEKVTWELGDNGLNYVTYQTPLKAVCDLESKSSKYKVLKILGYAGAGVVVVSAATFAVLRTFVFKKSAYNEIN